MLINKIKLILFFLSLSLFTTASLVIAQEGNRAESFYECTKNCYDGYTTCRHGGDLFCDYVIDDNTESLNDCQLFIQTSCKRAYSNCKVYCSRANYPDIYTPGTNYSPTPTPKASPSPIASPSAKR